MEIYINGTKFEAKNIEEADNNLHIIFEPNKTILNKLESVLSELESIEGYEGYDDVISMERRYDTNEIIVAIVKNVNAEEALKELTGGRLVTVKEARAMKEEIEALENAVVKNTKLDLDSIAPTLLVQKEKTSLIDELMSDLEGESQ